MNDAALVQGSREWLQARCGSLGARAVPDIVRLTKTGYSSARANLMAFKALERLTGRVGESFQNQAMLQGIEREPLALAAYSFMMDLTVERVGLVRHPVIEGAHASPDGLIGSDGLVEVKCPQPAAHMQTLLGETVERDYLIQMQWQLACTSRAWCHYVSWNPDFPPSMQLWTRRVFRDDEWIRELEKEVISFIGELDGKVDALRKRYGVEE